MQENIIILGIETSCDETSAAVIQNGKLLSNIVFTQEIHKEYGGTVPELASRAHIKYIVPTVAKALEVANIHKKDISGIAFTQGPGLPGALVVGCGYAKGLALGLNVPLLAVHHIKAHILAHFIEEPKPKFPFLCLTVSGGHTLIVLVKSVYDMEIIGSTQDDAAGEAFDKAAKMLGLPYPGGPLIDKYAKNGVSGQHNFPMPQMPNYDYSFSGIKTAILYYLQKKERENPHFIKENLANLCCDIQKHIVKILFQKLTKAAEELQIDQIAIAGGVSANSALRKRLENESESRDWEIYLPAFEFCTDNAAMVAMAGYYDYLIAKFAPQNVTPDPRLTF